MLAWMGGSRRKLKLKGREGRSTKLTSPNHKRKLKKQNTPAQPTKKDQYPTQKRVLEEEDKSTFAATKRKRLENIDSNASLDVSTIELPQSVTHP